MKTIYTWALVLLLAAIMTVPAALGYNAEPMDNDTDAQRAAQRQVREDQCTALYGSSAMFFETKGGHLVCRNGAMK